MIQVETREHGRRWRPAAEPERPPRPRALEGRRVLVVDDDADMREFLRTVLADGGAMVQAVPSVVEALTAFDRMPPDVLVSDIGMPEFDGFDLIEAIRQRPAANGGRVPAVALTGFSRIEDRRRAIASGFQVHVIKPVEPDEILDIVASLLRHDAPR